MIARDRRVGHDDAEIVSTVSMSKTGCLADLGFFVGQGRDSAKETSLDLLNLLKIASFGAKKSQLAKLSKNSKCAYFPWLERSASVLPSTI